MISHSAWWLNPPKPCSMVEADWRTHFPRDLIINYCLSGKLGKLGTLQWPHWLTGGFLRKASAAVLRVTTVLHASWCAWSRPSELTELLTCANTLKNHYSKLSHSHRHTHTVSFQRRIVFQSLSALSGLWFDKQTATCWGTTMLQSVGHIEKCAQLQKYCTTE